MRKVALGALILAGLVQAPLPLLAQPPETVPPVATPVSGGAEAPAPEPPPLPAEPPPLPAEPPVEQQTASGGIEAPAPAVPPEPVEAEGAPSEDRLSVGETHRSSSTTPPVSPAQVEEEPAGGDPVPDPDLPVDGQDGPGQDDPTDDGSGQDAEDPDEEEFGRDFGDDEEDEEAAPPPDTPSGGTASESASASLPSTGTDVLSMILSGCAMLLLGLSLRRVPPVRV